MPRLASRFVIATVIALAAAAPAQAVWEAPQRLDQTTEGFLNSGAGDVAVGDNGLATILFLQNDDAGTKLWATRRASDGTSWLTPPWRVSPTPSGGALSIEAAPDGATAGSYRVETEEDDDNPVTPETTVQSPHGLGWPSDATGAAPKTADFGDQGDESLPPVDADGRGFGWTAFVDGDLNLQIVRFSLTNPATSPATFEVEAVQPDPPGGNLNSTEARSNPRIDVNADGDVIVSFVEERMTAECCDPPGPAANAIWAVRKLQGQSSFSEPFRISHEAEEEAVDEHDPAIVDNGDATILFGADPEREETDRVFARRWLATSGEPRPESSIEFVSSSAATAPNVSQIRAEAGPTPNVTAAWVQGSAQLNSSERTTTWSQTPQTLSAAAGAYDIAVDIEGVATVVYREATTVKARRRASGAQWTAADTLNSKPVSAEVAPKVDAGAVNQADAYFVQNDEGSRRGAFATRFSGVPPVEPPAPPAPDTEGCPADVDLRFGGAGNDSITGDDNRQTMLGGDGNDSLFGLGGDDCILGQAGDDTVSGGAGVDTLGGGDGNDRVDGGDGDETLMNGGAGNDNVNGDAGNDRVGGGDGDDTVDGSAGDDSVDGEAGNDTVRGGDGNDLLGGADGNDTVSGNAGVNTLFGGLGNDTLLGGAEKDTMLGEDGDDVLSSGNGPDDVHGGAGNDKLRGGNGQNVLDGSLGNDGIRGGSQTDRVIGAEGNDSLFGLAGKDTLLGGAAADKAYGGSGNDRVSGDAARDTVRGGSGADRLFGGSGKDRLFGDSGKDRLSGGGAGDRLNGGGARDRISGGGGNDRIGAVDNKKDTITCGSGRDRVVADRVDKVSKSCERVSRRGRR